MVRDPEIPSKVTSRSDLFNVRGYPEISIAIGDVEAVSAGAELGVTLRMHGNAGMTSMRNSGAAPIGSARTHAFPIVRLGRIVAVKFPE
jgi:hypothetical protein